MLKDGRRVEYRNSRARSYQLPPKGCGLYLGDLSKRYTYCAQHGHLLEEYTFERPVPSGASVSVGKRSDSKVFSLYSQIQNLLCEVQHNKNTVWFHESRFSHVHVFHLRFFNPLPLRIWGKHVIPCVAAECQGSKGDRKFCVLSLGP